MDMAAVPGKISQFTKEFIMKNANIFASAVASMVLLAVPATRSAESAPPVKEADNQSRADLEAKVKMLEQRVQQLEQQLKDSNQRAENFSDWRQRRGFNRDMDEIMERLQREMQRDFGIGGQFTIPGGPGAPAGPGMRGMLPGSKPRLGVELAAPTDELKERFKNDIKEGAFVMSVVPGSPAEKAGLNVGDVITSFNGKSVSKPLDLIEAVKAAPPGKHDIEVARRGEGLKLKVDLGEAAIETDFPEEPKVEGGWLRRGDVQPRAGGTRSKTEVKASAFEVTNQLAQELNLTEEQRKKMSEVLNKHAAAVNEEASLKTVPKPQRRGRGFAFNMNSDITRMVEKHTELAEKELAGTLNADQISKWSDYRKTHNSVSVSQSTVIEGDGAPGVGNVNDDGLGF
jgi:membrane-associated protease RseP (regulator of RpoE activity)